MTGSLLTGLRMFHQITGRQDVARAIVRGAEWLWNEAWVEKDAGFWYAQCPKYMGSGGTWTVNLCGDGLAYAALLDKAYWQRRRDQIVRAFAAHLYRSGRSSFGKSFTQETCSLLYGLNWLRELGVRDVPESAAAEEKLLMRSALALLPGQTVRITLLPRLSAWRRMTCKLTVAGAPGWLRVEAPRSFLYDPAKPPALSVTLACSQAAKPGQNQEFVSLFITAIVAIQGI